MTAPEESYNRLQALAESYGCDKLFSHSYIPFYSELFYNRRIKRLLEIGIGYEGLMKPFVPFYIHGASLKMWRDFFPGAMIFACDIRPDTLINEDRITSVIADQADVADLLAIGKAFGPFDIVIDDGSHQSPHQIISAQTLIEFISPGGVYIIEDVSEPEKVTDAVGGEIVRFDKRPDDCLVVIQK